MNSISISKDSRTRFGAARDQGARPTCLALAMSDAHAAVRGPWAPLSAEYLYYHAKRREGGLPTPGATIPSIRQAVQEDGQPVESDWPYLPATPSDVSAWSPPTVGDVFRRSSERLGDGFDQAWDMAERGEPAVIVMRLSDAFYIPSAEGIVDSTEPADPARRHAVVAAAAGVQSGNRLILVRNSWGESWGISGYAWITEDYMVPRIIQVIALREAA
jgi:hypothetical protein